MIVNVVQLALSLDRHLLDGSRIAQHPGEAVALATRRAVIFGHAIFAAVNQIDHAHRAPGWQIAGWFIASANQQRASMLGAPRANLDRFLAAGDGRGPARVDRNRSHDTDYNPQIGGLSR